MATYTDNYDLKKPDQTEFYNVDDFNGNADIIDSTLHAQALKIESLEGVGGAVPHQNLGANPTQAALCQAFCEGVWGEGTFTSKTPLSSSTYVTTDGDTHTAAEIWNGTWMRNDYDNHRWTLSNTQNTSPTVFEFIDVGIDTVSIADEDTAGVIKSGGDIDVGSDGTVTVPELLQGYNQKPIIISTSDTHATFSSWVKDHINELISSKGIGAGTIACNGKQFTDLNDIGYWGITYSLATPSTLLGWLLINNSGAHPYQIKVTNINATPTVELKWVPFSDDSRFLQGYGLKAALIKDNDAHNTLVSWIKDNMPSLLSTGTTAGFIMSQKALNDVSVNGTKPNAFGIAYSYMSATTLIGILVDSTTPRVSRIGIWSLNTSNPNISISAAANVDDDRFLQGYGLRPIEISASTTQTTFGQWLKDNWAELGKGAANIGYGFIRINKVFTDMTAAGWGDSAYNIIYAQRGDGTFNGWLFGTSGEAVSLVVTGLTGTPAVNIIGGKGYGMYGAVIQSNDTHATFLSWLLDKLSILVNPKTKTGAGVIDCHGKQFSDIPDNIDLYWGISYSYATSGAFAGTLTSASSGVAYSIRANNLSSTDPAPSLELTRLDIAPYGVCYTAGDTAVKTVTIPGFRLVVGASVTVQFTNQNVVNNPTLNVNGTGAYPIYTGAYQFDKDILRAMTMQFVFDGSHYQFVGYNVSLMSVEEGKAGTVTTMRSINAVNLNQIIQGVAKKTIWHQTTYDLNRPDLWPVGSKLDLGDGSWGFHLTGSVTMSSSAYVNLITNITGASKLLRHGGFLHEGFLYNNTPIGETWRNSDGSIALSSAMTFHPSQAASDASKILLQIYFQGNATSFTYDVWGIYA